MNLIKTVSSIENQNLNVSSNSDSLSGELPPGKLPGGNLPRDSYSDPSVQSLLESKRRKRREKKVQAVLENSDSLSQTVQESLHGQYLADGWGMLAHGVARQLKSPKRFGLNLSHIALIMAVYDKTVAQVNSSMFAALSAQDFQDETDMDESNIRIALNSLVQRGVLLKIKTNSINFWALNPHYFSIKASDRNQGDLPPGNLPGGKKPPGNAPEVKGGNLPGGNGGQITRGQTSLTSGNQKTISASNNLQESFKESSLSNGDFPEDMQARWSRFEQVGYGWKAKEEREIFKELFIRFGKQFFENCGRVVQFLEKQGNGKEGDKGVIHSPMLWIKNHWELNLIRYQNWKTEQEDLESAHVQRINKEAKEKIEQAEKERQKLQEEIEESQWKEKVDTEMERFLSTCGSEGDIKAFIEDSIKVSGCSFTMQAWKTKGLDHPLVKSCVVNHFLKSEADAKAGRGHTRAV